MSKAQKNLTLSLETIRALDERAARIGVPVGDMADLCVRVGLERMTDEALTKWAASLPSTRGRLGGALTKNAKVALMALERLTARGSGAFRFEPKEIASEAGLYIRDAFRALGELEGRGLVKSAKSEDVDNWGRPVESAWWLNTKGGTR